MVLMLKRVHERPIIVTIVALTLQEDKNISNLLFRRLGSTSPAYLCLRVARIRPDLRPHVDSREHRSHLLPLSINRRSNVDCHLSPMPLRALARLAMRVSPNEGLHLALFRGVTVPAADDTHAVIEYHKEGVGVQFGERGGPSCVVRLLPNTQVEREGDRCDDSYIQSRGTRTPRSAPKLQHSKKGRPKGDAALTCDQVCLDRYPKHFVDEQSRSPKYSSPCG